MSVGDVHRIKQRGVGRGRYKPARLVPHTDRDRVDQPQDPRFEPNHQQAEQHLEGGLVAAQRHAQQLQSRSDPRKQRRVLHPVVQVWLQPLQRQAGPLLVGADVAPTLKQPDRPPQQRKAQPQQNELNEDQTERQPRKAPAGQRQTCVAHKAQRRRPHSIQAQRQPQHLTRHPCADRRRPQPAQAVRLGQVVIHVIEHESHHGQRRRRQQRPVGPKVAHQYVIDPTARHEGHQQHARHAPAGGGCKRDQEIERPGRADGAERRASLTHDGNEERETQDQRQRDE